MLTAAVNTDEQVFVQTQVLSEYLGVKVLGWSHVNLMTSLKKLLYCLNHMALIIAYRSILEDKDNYG
jgi:hypothetical protein